MRKNKENARRWRRKNPEKARDTWLKYTYGLTLEQYNILLEVQNNACAICGGQPNRGIRFCVDHDHKTGKVRGLLCFACNSGIGHLKDNITILLNAINYLNKGTK